MGGIEPTLYQGSVWYTPIVEEWYFQVEVLKLEVGDQNLDLDCREVRVKLSCILCLKQKGNKLETDDMLAFLNKLF